MPLLSKPVLLPLFYFIFLIHYLFMKYPLIVLIIVLSFTASAQDVGFPFGQVTYRELGIKTYEKDTSASAVILSEFGEAYFDNSGDHNLIFKYHVKIKILKKAGLKYADVEIPLGKYNSKAEILRSVKASAFTMENGSKVEFPVKDKNIFTDKNSASLEIKKFAIPSVVVGSVIEYEYELETPFIFNFRRWEFQSDIPKISSEYWATIPGNYIYNITLKGFLKLSKNENELIKDCFTPGANHADCARFKYAMKDVPAFIDEDYMTARSNFLSAVNFELSEVKYFDGRTDKITKEWKDADQELRMHQEFGVQLRKGKDIEQEIEPLIAGETDPLIKAKKIYYFIKDWFIWDENYGKYCNLGVRKAFDAKKGNIGDINLSLIAALQFADLDVNPVILSTRENGVPIDLHPVLSDFNYVVAQLNIGDQSFLLDATDDFHPFGILPERCLNGKGRVLAEKGSYWIEMKTKERSRQMSVMTLKLDSTGIATGTYETTFVGYEAIKIRKRIARAGNVKEYVEGINRRSNAVTINDFEFKNLEEIDLPLVQKLKVEASLFEEENDQDFLFNPFLFGKWEENPFRSSERLYPVDFGTPFEQVSILNLEYLPKFEIVNMPDKVGLALPNSGGRFLLDSKNESNRLVINSQLIISRTIFSSQEYHFLKELFNRIIQVQNTDLLFKVKR
jgi:hypothetical protein